MCLDNCGWFPALRGHTPRPQNLDDKIQDWRETAGGSVIPVLVAG